MQGKRRKNVSLFNKVKSKLHSFVFPLFALSYLGIVGLSRIRKQGSAVLAYSRCVDSFVTSSVRVDVVMSDGELVYLLSPIGKQIVFAVVVA